MTPTLELTPVMRAPGLVAVLDALEARGGRGCVRFVGGCVRNRLLGLAESDLDLSTQLRPDDTEAALAAAGVRSVPTGKAFGTISAIVDGVPYEITSLREDVETDGRRAVVSFTDDWGKDAIRRDFYLNALYADRDGHVFDLTGYGLSDLADRRVRFIGEADQRIREDYLRILRFFRFTAAFAQEPDPSSFAACARLKDGVGLLSAERIWDEMRKCLRLSDPVTACRMMQDCGVMPFVITGWQGAGSFSELERMSQLSSDIERRLIALIDGGVGLGADAVRRVQTCMRFSQETAARLVGAGEALASLEVHDLRRALYDHGRVAVEDAILLAAAHGQESPEVLLGHLAQTDIPVFPLRGADLVARGLPAGPALGAKLKAIEAEWLSHDFSQSVIDSALDRLGGATSL